MSKKEIPVAKAKGRPMLTWVGKKPLTRVTAFPAQHIETVPAPEPPAPLAAIDWNDWPRDLPQGGLLYHGDNKEAGVFRAEIPDWRAAVDCVLIDTDHDGEIFKIALADVPERKQDFVAGRYQLPAPRRGATVAVKIIDMLGEEFVLAVLPDPEVMQ